MATTAPVLVAEAADTLIAPGENGILYTMKLNTKFNRETGELSIDPSETVKLRYKTYRSSEQNYWLGMGRQRRDVGQLSLYRGQRR